MQKAVSITGWLCCRHCDPVKRKAQSAGVSVGADRAVPARGHQLSDHRCSDLIAPALNQQADLLNWCAIDASARVVFARERSAEVSGGVN